MTMAHGKTEGRVDGGVFWSKECPRFDGSREGYKNWKLKVQDWLEVYAEGVKYPGLVLRMSLEGRAAEIGNNVERETLKLKTGAEVLLEKLDEAYSKDTTMENYGKMRNFYGIKRDNGEDIKDFLVRYEIASKDCERALGRKMFDGEVEGFHVMEQASLTENQKQMVLAACGTGKLEYKKVVGVMRRVFESMKVEEHDTWWERDSGLGWRGRGYMRGRGRGMKRGGRGEKNPRNREGNITTCAICKSEWHWARECPKNYNNRGKEAEKIFEEEKEERKETVYRGREQEKSKRGLTEDWWEGVEAILDTGCKSTLCGEL